MPSQRDYKAEYQRRIQRGMARGLSRSQAAGHPKSGEVPASAVKRIGNPFAAMKNLVNDTLGRIEEIFRGLPTFRQEKQQNEVEYEYDQYVYGAHPLPSWHIGEEDSPANLADVNEMFRIVKVHRFQKSYAIVICGKTEEVYPGHFEEEGCLSYRLGRSKIENNLTGRYVGDLTTAVNRMLPEDRKEVWSEVTMFKVIDKD